MNHEPENDIDPEILSMQMIEKTRAVLRKSAGKCTEHGATVEDAAIAAILAAFDIAELHAGPGHSAVEWLRTGCDLLEKTVFENGLRVSFN